MSQRNRIPCAAITLVAALFVAAPMPSFAARLPTGRLPPAGAWEQAWSWFVGLVLPGGGASPRLTARWEKEGSAINPDGLTARWEKEGGAINPDGRTNPAGTSPAPPPPATLLAPKPDDVK
jgi:hypothetical protein